MLIASKDKEEVKHLKSRLAEEFDMKDLGPAKKILGMEILRDRNGRTLRLSQEAYVKKVLARFGMEDAKPAFDTIGATFQIVSIDVAYYRRRKEPICPKVPYASAVGSLMYTMVCTRPDLAQAVGVVSRYMANPRQATLASHQVDTKVSQRNNEVWTVLWLG